MLAEEVKKKLKTFPKTPGVYFFKDHEGNILYIGKAKNLRARTASYTRHEKRENRISTLLSLAREVSYLQTHSELEALLLEAELISKYKPEYNILLRDGQPFLYFHLSNEKLPRLELVRHKGEKGWYAGPFLEKTPLRNLHRLLLSTFKIQICKKKISQGCLAYHMGKCAGSCLETFDEKAYKKRLSRVKKLLTDGFDSFVKETEKEIKNYSTAMEFEQAQHLYDLLQHLKKVGQSLSDLSQARTFSEMVGTHLWVFMPEEKLCFLFQEYHEHIKMVRSFFLYDTSTSEEFFERGEEYLLAYYREFSPAHTILLSHSFASQKIWAAFITKWHARQQEVEIECPVKGHLFHLITLARLSAEQEMAKKYSLPQALKKTFKLSSAPTEVDCFDISHKQGRSMVGSCVRFSNGSVNKELCRRFKIKSVEGQNDYKALQECVLRRYAHNEYLPHLVVIDGGLGQLSAVRQILSSIECISIAKREERVFGKGAPQGIVITPHSLVGAFLIALRDYTHHFALSYHKLLADKAL